MRLGGAVLIAVLAAGCTDAFADAVETTRHEVKVGAAPRLVVESAGGGIEVKPGAAGVVKVEARRRAATKDEALALPVAVSADAQGAKVTFVRPSAFQRAEVSFVIEAPKDATLDLHTGGGPIAASGFQAGIVAKTAGGPIELEHLKGSVDARTGGGSIKVSKVEGTLQVDSGGGPIEVGQARLRGANRLHTGGGPIRCSLPGDARLNVDGHTGGGPAHNDFGLPGGRSGFSGKIGDGADGSLELKTGGGPISLSKG
jgi:hypothetical protein